VPTSSEYICPHDGVGRVVTYQRGCRGDPVGGLRRDELDRLEQVGLALPVASEKGCDARLKRYLGGPVTAKVHQGQVGDVHASV
jgi:hypothetical protein